MEYGEEIDEGEIPEDDAITSSAMLAVEKKAARPMTIKIKDLSYDERQTIINAALKYYGNVPNLVRSIIPLFAKVLLENNNDIEKSMGLIMQEELRRFGKRNPRKVAIYANLKPFDLMYIKKYDKSDPCPKCFSNDTYVRSESAVYNKSTKYRIKYCYFACRNCGHKFGTKKRIPRNVIESYNGDRGRAIRIMSDEFKEKLIKGEIQKGDAILVNRVVRPPKREIDTNAGD